MSFRLVLQGLFRLECNGLSGEGFGICAVVFRQIYIDSMWLYLVFDTQ